MNAPTHARNNDLDALQARFALRVTAHLSEHSKALPHDISERLRVARERAVLHARRQRAAVPATVSAGVQLAQGSVTLGQTPSWWLRLASLAPLLLLVVGLVFIQHLHHRAEIRAAADVDAALLADDLPPEAYRDLGFVTYLKLREP